MKKFNVVQGEDVPSSHLPFSPAIQIDGWVFLSGQASVDESGNIVNDTFEGEMRRSFENARKILNAAGLDFKDVVQVRNYVGKKEDLASFNTIYREYFTAPFPARTTLIGCLSDLLKFEVDMVAYGK
ncbi:MAG: RidA family protein [Saprospiraceae bacterium]|nr:RidA family protein [Saprospiraceae bacterium]